MRGLPRMSVIAALLFAAPAWAADAGSIRLDQLGTPRSAAPAAAPQIAQPPTQTQRAGAAAIQSVAPPPSRPATAGVAQAQSQIDLCEKITAGQSRPVAGLDCSRPQLEELQQQLQAEAAVTRPTPLPNVNTLESSIDTIGRLPNGPGTFNGVPPVVIIGPR